MRHPIAFITLALAGLLLSGCSKDESPTFLFWNFRTEIQEETYHVPGLSSQTDAKAIQPRLQTIPGYVDAQYNLPSRTITVKYKSSQVRKMNFEEAIAQAGYAANNRPAAAPKNMQKGQ